MIDLNKPVCLIDENGDPIQGSYRHYLPEKWANTYPYHAATHRHESDGWVNVTSFTIPVGHVVTSSRTLVREPDDSISEQFTTDTAENVASSKIDAYYDNFPVEFDVIIDTILELLPQAVNVTNPAAITKENVMAKAKEHSRTKRGLPSK